MTQKEEFNKSLEILQDIEDNVDVCCAITMEPDEVTSMIEELRTIIEKLRDE